jgi:glycosyltransferase involved in cell wall biosynthesis
MELRLYQLSDFIGVMSPANKTYLLERYPNLTSKVELLPNAIDLTSSPIITSDKITIRSHYGLPVDKVISVFGGNIGKPQGVKFILDVIKNHESVDNSFLLFVGSGTEYDKLNSFILSNNIQNARCLPQLSKKEFDELLYHCDIGLLFLDYRFTFPNFPSRILNYFEFSKPVLAATDNATDIKDVLEQHQTGKWVMSLSAEAFINELKQLVEDETLRNQLGKNARRYLEQHWTVDKVYSTIITHL